MNFRWGAAFACILFLLGVTQVTAQDGQVRVSSDVRYELIGTWDVDQLNKDLFVDFVAYVAKNPKNATEVAHLLFTAKNLERIGDHTTTVAQMIYFTETGENLPDA